MSRWKRVLLVLSSAGTLLVMAVVTASATGGTSNLLRSAAGHATLLASTAREGGASSTSGSGTTIKVKVGDVWKLDGDLLVHGTITITCGPFVPASTSGPQVLLEESSNGKVGHAQGSIAQLNCNGSAHPNDVTVLVSDVPFAPAGGVVQVSGFVCGQDPGTFQFSCANAQTLAKVRVTS